MLRIGNLLYSWNSWKADHCGQNEKKHRITADFWFFVVSDPFSDMCFAIYMAEKKFDRIGIFLAGICSGIVHFYCIEIP